MYFNYHRYLKKKIKNNELVKWEFINNYKNLGYVMLLYFNDGKVYPVRKENIVIYLDFIENQFNKKEDF